MNEDTALFVLLLTILPLASALLVVASALLGRKMADLEYQRAAGLNGVRSIQARVNIRIHGNRILLAMTFLVTTLLVLVGVPLGVQQWVGRILFSLTLVAFLMTAVLDWFDDRRQVWILFEQEKALNSHGTGREATDAHSTG